MAWFFFSILWTDQNKKTANQKHKQTKIKKINKEKNNKNIVEENKNQKKYFIVNHLKLYFIVIKR